MLAPESLIAICGHAQHGKSTLAGRLMYEMEAVSDRLLDSLEKKSRDLIPYFERDKKKFNRYSLLFLYRKPATFKPNLPILVPDNQSRTVIPTRGSVEMQFGRMTIIDTPGWSRYLNNTIYGISQSDQAILTIAINDGVTDRTKQIMRILQSFAIPIVSVCITKMDMVDFSNVRYKEVKSSVRQLLGRQNKVPIIPVSALEGVGLSDRLQWYSGPTLIEALQNFQKRYEQEISVAARFVVTGVTSGVFSPPGVGTVLVGTLEAGRICEGDSLRVEPISTATNNNFVVTVRSMEIARSVTEKKGKKVKEGRARSIVAISTPEITLEEAKYYVRHGAILGPIEAPPNVAKHIKCELVFFEMNKVYNGKEYIFNGTSFKQTGRIVKVISIKKGIEREYSDSGVYQAISEEIVKAEIKFHLPISIEFSPRYQRLSTFVVREQNKIVACGRCTSIVE